MNDNLIALPYTRVSSTTQETHGSGNDSQELRCREHATRKGWPVGEVFRDTFTGAGDFMDRPEMRRLIQYIKDNNEKKFVVIFDDIKRLARDTVSFILLTQLFKSLDVCIECLNHKIEDTPEGEFISTILAAQGQLERKQNARQVTQKTEAHLKNGDWPYIVPVGYVPVAVTGQKRKLLCVNSAIGQTVKTGLKGFANGRFRTVSELGRYLFENDCVKNTRPNTLYNTTRKLLENIFYAGYIHFPEKGIVMVKGKHEAMITLEEHYQILERLRKEAKGEKEYQKFRDEYELRQLVRCVDCGNKLRSGTSKGRSKYYHYYTCRTKDCTKESAHISAKDMHDYLHVTLQKIESTDEVIEIGIEAFNEAFQEVIQSKGLVASEVQKSIHEVDAQIDVLVTNLGKVTNESVVRGVSSKIEELDIERKILVDKQNKVDMLDEKSRTALSDMKQFLKSPYDTWMMCDARQQRTLYRYIFSEDFLYLPKTESRTISLSPLYAYFSSSNENSPFKKESISCKNLDCGQ